MVVRARDLRANIKEYGFEQGMVRTFEEFLDEYAGHRQNIRDLAQLLAQCIDNVEMMTKIGEGMKETITELKRVMEGGWDGGRG